MLRPVPIRTGITDGAFTEVMGPPDRIREGQQIIVGLTETAASASTATAAMPSISTAGTARSRRSASASPIG